MVPFAGWDMPIRYGSVLDEHRACRTERWSSTSPTWGRSGSGRPGAHDTLQGLLTNDLGRIGPGQAQYTHLLDDDASVVDDLIVWWVGEEEFLVIPNASNTAPLAALEAAAASASGGVDVEHVTEQRALLAVQGPEARATWRRWRRRRPRWPNSGCATHPVPTAASGFVGGTGYTGEDGVELHVPVEAAVGVWRALVAAGVTPAGLGRAGHAPAGDGLSVARPRARPGHHAAAGRPRLGRAVRQGRLPRRGPLVAERERGVPADCAGS